MWQNLATFVYFTKITAVTYSIIKIIPVSIVLDEVTEQNIVSQIDDITEEVLTPVKFLDQELKDDCVTAALLGLDCLKEDDSKNQLKNQPKSQPKKAERLNDEIDSQFVLISTSNSEQLVTEILEPVTEIVMVTQINEVTEQILVNQMDEVKALGLDVGFGYLVPDFEVDETTILPKGEFCRKWGRFTDPQKIHG